MRDFVAGIVERLDDGGHHRTHLVRRSRLVVFLALILGIAPIKSALSQQSHEVVILAYNYIPGQAGELGLGAQAALPVMISQGDGVTGMSLDETSVIGPHTITADAVDVRTHLPVFDSPAIGFMQSQPVAEVETLPPGTYPFHCKFHPFMHGVLIVQ